MYADTISDAMDYAIKETERRRKLQQTFNELNDVVPITVVKDIRDKISIKEELVEEKDYSKMSMKDRQKLIKDLESQMKEAAKNLDFEKAAELRDYIFELRAEN